VNPERSSAPAWTTAASGTGCAVSNHEVMDFFGTPGARLAGCTHVPDGTPLGGLVICPSIFNEFTKNYRREVALARVLARQGVAVQRFHYRSTGHSDDNSGGLAFDTMCDDALTAVQRLRDLSGVERIVILGTRFGALVASTLSTRLSAVPVAILEPILEPERFFREGFRANMAQGIKGNDAAPNTTEQLQRLRATGALDVVGDTVGLALYESSVGRTVLGELGDRPRPVFLAQLGADQPLRRDFAQTATALRERGFDVETQLLGRREQWWFVDERDFAGVSAGRPLDVEPEDEIVTALARWLHAQLTPETT
jgi:alpha/beta superfamily hydrolase